MGFPQTSVVSAPLVCGVCGSPKPQGEVCRRCRVRLIDLALSSASEEFPHLVEDLIRDNPSVQMEPQWRYDHYEISRTASGDPWELGRGSMGITYKAMDTHLACPVALKIINPRYLSGAKARERFLREARTAAQLRHPNIASVFHLGLGEENCFYAMEFIEGETLEARIHRDGPLPPAASLYVCVQIARALKAAHVQRFVHRDIKPTNIMIVGGGRFAEGEMAVKVIDFGLVKAVVDDEAKDPACLSYFAGTPHYASAEQLKSGTADARSDICSLGKCLWHMLAGSPPPVAGISPAEKLFLKLPAPLVSLILSMVAEDVTLRPQTADELLERIQACLASSHPGKPLEGQTSGHVADRRPASPNGSRWIGLTCTMIVGAGMAIVGLQKSLPVASGKTNMPDHTAMLDARDLCAKAAESDRKNTTADNERAIALYSAAIARCPSYADAHAALAAAYFQEVARFGKPASHLDLAVASAEHAISLAPNNPKGFAALGMIRSWQGRHWEALTQIHRALELDPRHLQSMRNFSLLWTSVGQPQLGLPWSLAAAEAEPSNTAGWTAAAEACVDLCADEQARGFYERCLKINPGWMSAICGLLHIHLLEGNFAQAKRDYAVAEATESGLILPLTLKGQIDLFSGDYSVAVASYRRLIAMDRRGMVNYYGGISYLSALGFLLCQTGDAAGGTALLQEAAGMHVGDSEGPQAIYDLAAIRSTQGRADDALSLLRRAVDAGWLDYRSTRLDPRFLRLRTEPAFQQMLAELTDRVNEMREEADKLCAKPLILAEFPVQPAKEKKVR